MFTVAKIYHRTVFVILFCLCSLWLIMSLSGCNQSAKNFFSDNALINGDVTLLWNEIPYATSYNVYVSKSPGVTKLSGYKFQNVTNPFRINKLVPGQTYYFVVTAVNGAEESKESKELSYYAVADKIGLIYWKNIFDKSIQDHKPDTAETRQEIKDVPESTIANAQRAPLENETLSDKIADEENSSGDLAKGGVAKTTNIEQDLLEETRLRAAQMLADSYFYIIFEQNSNELSPKAIEKLDRIYKILTNNSDAKLAVNGYSDSSGAPDYNQIISEVRANSVKSYLSGRGIKSSRIMVLGHGAKKFLASNKSAEGRRLNRRVEIELIIP
jgi:outer membrane protein OmpA-like peptidoglycan-associated protein